MDFSAAEKARGVKFCTRVGLLSEQVFSAFGEHWLAGSHGGDGITSRVNPLYIRNAVRMTDVRSLAQISKPAATVGGHSELAAEASTKAVWCDLGLQAC